MHTVVQLLKTTNYSLAKRLRVATQVVDRWTGKVTTKAQPEGMSLVSLCRMRHLSGLTWNQFGKMMDKEFLDEKWLEEEGRKKS